jgi:glucose/arabinose dehydrogenase
MRNWPSVIVPTGITYHTGANMPPGYTDNLFVCSYEDNQIIRMEMFGTLPVNINMEHTFAQLTPSMNSNKPLDIIQGNDGSLFVSTFTQIWRIYARTGP